MMTRSALVCKGVMEPHAADHCKRLVGSKSGDNDSQQRSSAHKQKPMKSSSSKMECRLGHFKDKTSI